MGYVFIKYPKTRISSYQIAFKGDRALREIKIVPTSTSSEAPIILNDMANNTRCQPGHTGTVGNIRRSTIMKMLLAIELGSFQNIFFFFSFPRTTKSLEFLVNTSTNQPTKII